MKKPLPRHIAVLGAGESGLGAALLAKAKGIGVFVSDQGKIKPEYLAELQTEEIEYEAEGHTYSKLEQAELVIKSPGIPEDAAIIQKLVTSGIPVISEIEWAGYFITGKIIGITGTNGKTTTTTLIHWILTHAGYNAALTGNVGHSLARQVALEDNDYYVVELSSFQLDGLVEFKCHTAILLNITPDHLDRYGSMEAYIRSKMRIALNQTPEDYFIYNADDPIIVSEIEKASPPGILVPFSQERKLDFGAYIEDDQFYIKTTNQAEKIMNMDESPLQGKHNRSNSMAAGVSTSIQKVRKNVIRESLKSFQNIPHRMERVRNFKEVEYINDSKATNVNSAWFALESINGPVIWLAGGTDKGNNYQQLKPLVRTKVKTLIAIGKDNSRLLEAYKKDVPTLLEAETMAEAVKLAAQNAQAGYTVLLSPACASFDKFQNYEDRGRQFKASVHNLL